MSEQGNRGTPTKGKCPVCFNDCESVRSSTRAVDGMLPLFVECPRCGQYRAADSMFTTQGPDPAGLLGPEGGRIRADLSAFIQERQDNDGPPIFLSDDFLDPEKHDPLGDVFRSRPPLSFHERADKLLKALAKEHPGAGNDIGLEGQELKLQARAWAIDGAEWREILRYLYQSRRLDSKIKAQFFYTRIAPGGWQRLEELEKEGSKLDQGFVAMWFDEELDPFEKAVAEAIRCAGYAPLRIDKRPGEERIDHRIEVELKKSRFVVADFTGHRGGVYFEAGFARALGRPVFFTCHEDDFEKRHFDTKQFACLRWDCRTLEQLKTDLRYSIENVCGRGPVPVEEEKC